jgi:hypothetical protein
VLPDHAMLHEGISAEWRELANARHDYLQSQWGDPGRGDRRKRGGPVLLLGLQVLGKFSVQPTLSMVGPVAPARFFPVGGARPRRPSLVRLKGWVDGVGPAGALASEHDMMIHRSDRRETVNWTRPSV